MKPERRKCGQNSEADGSVELTRSGRPEAYGSSRLEGQPEGHCQSRAYRARD